MASSSSSRGALNWTMKKYGPALGMLYVQVAYAAMFLITRFALTLGMSSYSFVLYRQLIATLTICPLAYYLHRDSMLILRLKNVRQIFLLALMGISISQNFYYAGLASTSSTFVSTMNNLQPATTFLLAYLLRLEQVNIKSWRGRAKILGTLLCLGGVMVMTLVKDSNNLNHEGLNAQPIHGDKYGSFILGALYTILGTVMWSAFLIYQAWIVEEYPSQLSLSGLVSFMGSLQCAIIILLLEKPSALRLQWDLQLLAVAYSGIFCAGFAVFTIMWCVKEKGPVYATAFNPMSAVLVAIFEPLLLQVHPSWSSLTGMLMVIGGLYLFLWGKAQDRNVVRSNAPQHYMDGEGEGSVSVNEACSEESSNHEPLLAENNT